MLFSKNNKAVAYLGNKYLKLYNSEGEKDEEVDFPSSAVHKNEVADKEKFEDLLITFLAKADLKKQKAIIVLAKETLYETLLPSDLQDIEETAKKFFADVPVENKKLSKNIYQFDKEVRLIGVNKSIFSEVRRVFEKVGWDVTAVVPGTLFKGVGDSENLSADNIKTILRDDNTIANGNLLSDMKEEKEEPVEAGKTEEKEEPVVEKASNGSGKRKILFILGGIFVLLGLVLAGITVGVIKDPSRIQSLLVKATPTPTPTPTIAATPTPIEEKNVKREEVKIQILNGTGVPGQALRVKNRLVKYGYDSFELTNAKTTDEAGDTEIVFYQKANAEIRDEITTEMKKVFETVTTRRDPSPSSNFDVVITTGKEL